MVDTVEVVVHLGAERAARERVIGVARQPLRAAVPDFHHPGAGVGTVVPACAADDVKWSRRHQMPSIATIRGRLAPVKVQIAASLHNGGRLPMPAKASSGRVRYGSRGSASGDAVLWALAPRPLPST